jgi:hypothetical protein
VRFEEKIPAAIAEDPDHAGSPACLTSSVELRIMVNSATQKPDGMDRVATNRLI